MMMAQMHFVNNVITLVLHVQVEIQITVRLVQTRQRLTEFCSEAIHVLAKMDFIMWVQIKFVVSAIIHVPHVLGVI
jgi:hypothetical protein